MNPAVIEIPYSVYQKMKLELQMLKEQNRVLRSAHIKIKNGGIENGVLGNVTERMLKMCELSEEALNEVNKLDSGDL